MNTLRSAPILENGFVVPTSPFKIFGVGAVWHHDTDHAAIHAEEAAQGLHGYPQTHVIWHKIAGRLAERYTVIRGYGDERDGDTLRICYDLSGKSRPTQFKTKEETQLFLVTYKQEKP
jgi:hypothetical protein